MLDRSGLEVLDAAECIRLLAKTTIGRVIFTENALPAVRPVNFAVYEASSARGARHYVIVRTADCSDLIAATRDTVVGFQADDINLEQRSGWSVSLVGRVDLVDDPEQAAALAALPLSAWDGAAWDAGGTDRFLRIRIERMRGRRISTPLSPPD
jgi:nitroimidazol reductase NimA-like FMN-containing flavoprotein (pyridoxamine 5'-phosphate oxidase superfamily)